MKRWELIEKLTRKGSDGPSQKTGETSTWVCPECGAEMRLSAKEH